MNVFIFLRKRAPAPAARSARPPDDVDRSLPLLPSSGSGLARERVPPAAARGWALSMSERNVISLQTQRRARGLALDDAVIAVLVLIAVEAMMFFGMLSAFFLTRASAGAEWPPSGQPWFGTGQMALNSVALVASGALVVRAGRLWLNPGARVGPTLLAAIALGAFFLFFQGFAWLPQLRAGLPLLASHHGKFFCMITGMHAAHALGGLVLLGLVWLRLAPLRDDGEARGAVRRGTFSAVRALWYFVVALWVVLYACLYR